MSRVAFLFLFVVSASSTAFADQQPLSPSDLRPTLVTIHKHHVYAPDVIAELSRVSGIPIRAGWCMPDLVPEGYIDGACGEWLPISVDVNRRPFWDVLREICESSQSKVTFDRPGFGAGDQNFHDLTIETFQRHTPAYFCNGPVMLEIGDVTHATNTSLDPRDGEICLKSYWEPRLDVICADTQGLPPVVTDDRGEAIGVRPATAPSRDGVPGYGSSTLGGDAIVCVASTTDGCAIPYKVRLRLPQGENRRLGELKGIVRVWVATKWQRFEVPIVDNNLDNPAAFKLDDGHRLTIGDDGWDFIRLGLSREGLSAEKWVIYRHFLGGARLRYFNAKNEQMEDRGMQKDWEDLQWYDHDVTRDARPNFDIKHGEPVRVVVEFPVEQTEIDTPYDVHDLPINVRR